VVICLEQNADCLHMVQLMRLHPKTPSPLASLKSRLVLHFWCRLNHFVLEKRPLNGCSSSSCCCFLLTLLLGVERCRRAERCPPSVRNGRNPSVYWSPRKKRNTFWRRLAEPSGRTPNLLCDIPLCPFLLTYMPSFVHIGSGSGEF